MSIQHLATAEMLNAGTVARRATVISLASRRGYRPDWAAVACARLAAARVELHMDHDAFAACLTDALGWPVEGWCLDRWERGMAVPPADVYLAADHAAYPVSE